MKKVNIVRNMVKIAMSLMRKRGGVMVDSWDAEKEEIINKIIADGNMQLE